MAGDGLVLVDNRGRGFVSDWLLNAGSSVAIYADCIITILFILSYSILVRIINTLFCRTKKGFLLTSSLLNSEKTFPSNVPKCAFFI